jgi:hypothetical protein
MLAIPLRQDMLANTNDEQFARAEFPRVKARRNVYPVEAPYRVLIRHTSERVPYRAYPHAHTHMRTLTWLNCERLNYRAHLHTISKD